MLFFNVILLEFSAFSLTFLVAKSCVSFQTSSPQSFAFSFQKTFAVIVSLDVQTDRNPKVINM